VKYLFLNLRNKLYCITKLRQLQPICIGCIYYVHRDSRMGQTLALVDITESDNIFCVLLMPSMEAIYLSKRQLKQYIANSTIDFIELLPEFVVDGLKKEFMHQINTNHQYDLTKTKEKI